MKCGSPICRYNKQSPQLNYFVVDIELTQYHWNLLYGLMSRYADKAHVASWSRISCSRPREEPGWGEARSASSFLRSDKTQDGLGLCRDLVWLLIYRASREETWLNILYNLIPNPLYLGVWSLEKSLGAGAEWSPDNHLSFHLVLMTPHCTCSVGKKRAKHCNVIGICTPPGPGQWMQCTFPSIGNGGASKSLKVTLSINNRLIVR